MEIWKMLYILLQKGDFPGSMLVLGGGSDTC